MKFSEKIDNAFCKFVIVGADYQYIDFSTDSLPEALGYLNSNPNESLMLYAKVAISVKEITLDE